MSTFKIVPAPDPHRRPGSLAVTEAGVLWVRKTPGTRVREGSPAEGSWIAIAGNNVTIGTLVTDGEMRDEYILPPGTKIEITVE